MPDLIIPALIEGGKASAGPPLGPALGPTGININEVIEKINEATKDFQGVTVPVKVIVNASAKTFEIEVGSPPTSALIKKELGIEKAVKGEDGGPVGDLSFESLLKVSKMKHKAALGKTLKDSAKQVLGTCVSMGVQCDGKSPREIIKEIDSGSRDKEFSEVEGEDK